MLNDIMKQYVPNNFIPEQKHYISATILFTLIIVAWYFRINKVCRSDEMLKALPIAIKKSITSKDEELSTDKLENIPLKI